jgi:hypothetical protein
MALLTGKVKNMRLVEGEYKDGKRKGEKWEFLSLEIIDAASGFVWSCQLPSADEQYTEVAQDSLVGHKVKVTVMSQTAAEREIGTNGSTRKIMQIRSQITNVRDLGRVTDDDE